jgi:hypothetical protein
MTDLADARASLDRWLLEHVTDEERDSSSRSGPSCSRSQQRTRSRYGSGTTPGRRTRQGVTSGKPQAGEHAEAN